MGQGGVLLGVIAVAGFLWPRVVAWPAAFICLWFSLALLGRALRRRAPPS